MSNLKFDSGIPVAPKGLGGIPRDHFGNGRLYATVSAHGGLTDIAFHGQQNIDAQNFFRGNPESSWVKCFRVYAGVHGERHYLTLNDTVLHPFGYESRCNAGGVSFEHQMLFLPDALVQRFKVIKNSKEHPLHIAALHQESCTAVNLPNRTWSDFKFEPKLNALIASCIDRCPVVDYEGSLAQRDLDIVVRSGLKKAVTWIGIGCDTPIKYHRGYHERSKHYLTGATLKGDVAAMFMVFATSREGLLKRLGELRKSVHKECNDLLAQRKAKRASRPQIETGNKVLDSAFTQYPECIDTMRLPDRPGAIKATLAFYYVWGWDSMTAPLAFNLANDPDATAENLRFHQQTLNRRYGIPHAFTASFGVAMKAPFPAQAQFITDIYHYVSTTGDLTLARELLPTCKFILKKSKELVVKNTGLASGYALWPDFPEAMEENGHDISSMNNSVLYQGLRAMEFIAAALGEANYAEECRAWAAKLRASFVKYLYDAKKGFFIASCDSRTFKPRSHYCPQSVFWLTPFARELTAHDPVRIADFMVKELRRDKCLLTLPHWDTAWMADGNQLGSTFPAADHFYLNAQKLVGNAAAIEEWTGDVAWFWGYHTAPEAFTPEAENEAEFGVDNPGCKQLQSLTTWYVGLFEGLAGLEFDHEGIVFTPCGTKPLSIKNLRLRGCSIDLKVSGAGNHVGSIKLNGRKLSKGVRKIAWNELTGRNARLELVRTKNAPGCPVIVRADGLRVEIEKAAKGVLIAQISGTMSGEAIVQAPQSARISLNGKPAKASYCKISGTFTIHILPNMVLRLKVNVS